MNHLLDLESKEIKINRGGKMRFIVSAYNDGRFEDNPVGLFFQQCISESGENTTSISLVSPLQSFAVGTDAGWAAIILVNQTTKSGKYLCELRASDGNDFLLDGLVVEVI